MSENARRVLALVLALALLAAAGLLLARSRDRDGVTVTKTTLPAGTGRLYRPAGRPGETVLELPDEDGGHTHAVSTGGGSAALLLGGRHDGADGLATELARRGVAVLSVSEGVPAGEAWDLLIDQDFVRLSSAALIASPGRGAEALALAAELSGGGREPAAVVVMGDGELLETAARSPGRNLLFFADAEPDTALAEAFLGEPERKPGWIGGYFAEGTARRLIRSAPRRWDAETALAPVIDWLGSALGHAVEIPDGDLIAPERRTCAALAAAALIAGLAAAAGAVLPRRKRTA